MKRLKLYLIFIVLAMPILSMASVTVTVNGSNHTIPQTNERGWGNAVTAWIQAISQYTLQPTGGAFSLTADADFGSSYGLKTNYLSTRTANPSGAGLMRLAKTDYIGWRNNANSGNLLLAIDSSDNLTFNGVIIPTPSSGSFADNGFFLYDNGDVTKKLAFEVSGVGTGTTKTITVPNANVNLGALTNSNIDASAAIAYSKLNLTGGILNADVNSSAAIAYSKLNLSGGILNADVNSSAAIALSKLAALGTSKALQSNASTGAIEASSVTNTELGYVSGVTSAVQTQLDAKVAKSTYTTKGDILAASAASTPARVAVGSDGTFLKADSSQTSGLVWASVAGSALAVASKTTTYTATTSDDFIAVTTGSAWTLTLYAASGNSGKVLRVKKTSSDVNALTIDANASETIDGALTTTIISQYEEIILICDGTNWHILSRDYPRAWVSYTPTGSWSTNTTYTGRWRRSGDQMEGQIHIALTGAPTSAALTANLPTNYTVDTAKLAGGTGTFQSLGTAAVGAGGGGYNGFPSYTSTTALKIKYATTSVSDVTQAAPATFANGDSINVFFRVPIVGWN